MASDIQATEAAGQANGSTDPGVRPKPRKNLHWIFGGVVCFLLAIILVGRALVQDTKPAAQPADQTGTAIDPQARTDEVKRLLDEQLAQAKEGPAGESKGADPLKRPSTVGVISPVTPEPADRSGPAIPAELARAVERSAGAGTGTGTGSGSALPAPPSLSEAQIEAIRRDETIRAAPIQVGQVTVSGKPNPGGDASPLGGMDMLQRQLLALQGQSTPATPPVSMDQALAAIQAMNGRPGGFDSGARSNSQWMERTEGKREATALQVRPPAAKHVIQEGTVIPATLVTRVNSDLPGRLTAVVAQDVYDSITSRSVLIPKGSRLIGEYNNEIRPGQKRVLFMFRRIILPNGQSVDLVGMPGVDGVGQSGAEGDVNNHFFRMFGSAFLIAVMGNRFTDSQVITTPGAPVQQTTDIAGEVLTDTARVILERNRNIPPTITLDQGTRMNVMVSRDIAMEPFRE